MPALLNPVWTDLPQITQLWSLCCIEEATARLVYCDIFLPVTAVMSAILISAFTKEVRCTDNCVEPGIKTTDWVSSFKLSRSTDNCIEPGKKTTDWVSSFKLSRSTDNCREPEIKTTDWVSSFKLSRSTDNCIEPGKKTTDWVSSFKLSIAQNASLTPTVLDHLQGQ